MQRRTVVYVTAIAVAAVATAAAVFAMAPGLDERYREAALCFGALAALSHLFWHRVGRATTGSIASIPYLASVIVAPHWTTVVALAVAAAVEQVSRRSERIKAVFNVAQYSLGVAASVLVFRASGGVSLLADPAFRFVPYAAAVAAFFFVNTCAVSGVLAISERRRPLSVWLGITRGVVVYDLLASPLSFVFGWVYVTHGAVWVAGLAVPLLAVRQVFKTNRQLEQTNQELLELMVKAIEARDPYTSGHSQRVSYYAKLIARAVGLSARQVERVTVAALLHDVGKIHEIYAPILSKPDKLTLEERMVMETHPLKSAELVSTVSQLRDVLPAIRHHHENWDGSGYPDGISGREIPLAARIIMLADTIDAMTTDRPYRKALDQEAVRRELVRLRGIQFDPDLCDTLLRSPLFAQLFAGKTATLTPVSMPAIPAYRTASQRQVAS